MGAAYSDGMSTADNTPRKGDYKRARGAVEWVIDKRPEEVIREMRDNADERPPLEYPNELARRAARGLGASTHKPPADDPAPS
jgi:hypothetical protein